ncbi:hypothetical protein [Phytomonospora endophytica]|uniref:Knr4/Smi1-like domain-containing protein n=1 Tax=Phytomonospora endophytica TaxID=714109 RepID=A0A841FXF8_9ACTN|nr:hypothetical protein [Phytomonospora endophytica]MBB6038037.1 hypothetical protein [Phytomonospora endophytica]GIG68938.1 hypothetical protein Pen01_52330 [Phytomonospora endophytica]
MNMRFEEFLGVPMLPVPNIGWDEIEAELGLVLPADYKAWGDRYRTIRIAEYLIIENLRSLFGQGTAGNLRDRVASPFGYIRDAVRRDASAPLRTTTGLFPYQAQVLNFYPESSGLLYVGLGDNNEVVGLLPPGGDRNDWKIVVTDAREWWIYDGKFEDFLKAIVTGGIECDLFPWLSEQPVVLEELVSYESTEGGVIPRWRRMS